MPRRSRDKFGEYHGKHKYISAHFNQDWAEKEGQVEIKSHIELEQGETVDINTKTDVEIEGEITDYKSEDVKNARRKKILDNHPDRGGSEEELKKILDEEG